MGLNVIQDAGPEGVPHGLVTGLSGGTEQRGSGSSNHVQPSLTPQAGRCQATWHPRAGDRVAPSVS